MEWNPRQRHSALRIVALADLPIPAQPCPGADVVRASPVPVQMWQGWAQSRCRCGGDGPTMERLDPPLIQFERPARHIVQKVPVVGHLSSLSVARMHCCCMLSRARPATSLLR
jgi:hypothetical protein